MECIFCRIIKKEIPTTLVYEDDFTIAFLDAHPHSKGHTLVIPKDHYENLLVTPLDIQEKLLVAINKSVEILKGGNTSTKPNGFNITSNIGKSAGQIIFHTHIHIIPRYE